MIALGAALVAVSACAADRMPVTPLQESVEAKHGTRPTSVAEPENAFSMMLDKAMNVMNDRMVKAPVSDDPDHDFSALMIPHHQGAVDIAKAKLLYGTNPTLRRLAQEIIITRG